MSGLRELQTQFTASLFDTDETDALASIVSGQFEHRQRMQVYRNNVFSNLTEALRAVYPVVEKLVGEGFFLYASNEYIRRFPSNSGDLHDYGAKFGDFLKTFEAASQHAYLPEVANLEWYYHEVYHEADAAGLDVNALSTVAPDRYQALCFSLNPASRLLQSEFPIIEIWRINQEDYQGNQTVDLGSGGVNVLLLRQAEEVELHTIPEADFKTLDAMRQQQSLEHCISEALSIDQDFDLGAFLYKYIHNKTIASMQVQ